MSDSADFKNLVRRRMAATGEKYTQAHRALITQRAEKYFLCRDA